MLTEIGNFFQGQATADRLLALGSTKGISADKRMISIKEVPRSRADRGRLHKDVLETPALTSLFETGTRVQRNPTTSFPSFLPYPSPWEIEASSGLLPM